MIECYRIQTGWFVVSCDSCQMTSYHDNVKDAEDTGVAHERLHDIAQGSMPYSPACGDSMGYEFRLHFQALSLN